MQETTEFQRYEDGTISLQLVYRGNGTLLLHEEYDENGVRRLVKKFFESGALKTVTTLYENGNIAESTQYYESGAVLISSSYSEDDIPLHYTIYYESGEIQETREYNGTLAQFTRFHQGGKLYLREFYEYRNGFHEHPTLLKRIFYNPDGSIREEIEY